MAWHRLLPLLLIWTCGHDAMRISGTHCNPQEQSWKKRDLVSVPDNLDARLRRLDVSNNFITQLHSTLGLPHLRSLDVSSNQLELISEGAFVELARLEELNLANNALNNNLGSNSKALQSVSERLKTLDISMNRLDDGAAELYLRNQSSLVRLRLAGNGLTRLTRDLFRDSVCCLRSIGVDGNLIAHVERGTFEPLRRLEALNLARNNLARICDFRLHRLKHLNLSRNSIEFFVTQWRDEDHNKPYRLETLDLSHNRLLYFPIVPKINRLRYLYLQDNVVGASHSEEATIVSDATSLYNEITRGGGEDDDAVKHENVTNVYSDWRLMPLVHIDLSDNHFRSFPLETLGLLTSLETLNFSNNCLRTIGYNVTEARLESECHRQPSLFSSLRTFALQNNKLVHISPLFLEALENLETLNLQENHVKPCGAPGGGGAEDHLGPFDSAARQITTSSNVSSCVAFGRMTTLKHLNLKENGIKTLYPYTFEMNPLVSLNLAGNPDMFMQAGALEGSLQRTLESLSVSDTNATSLSWLPCCLPALTHLNVSDNRLDVVPVSLSCSPSLRELDIRNNAFRSLNPSLIRDISVHLDAVYVSGNRFNCCDDSQWVTILLNESETKVPDIGGAECVAEGVDNVVLLSLTDYLKEPATYCRFHTRSQEVSVGQATIVVIFVGVVFTMLIVFIREALCHRQSFIV